MLIVVLAIWRCPNPLIGIAEIISVASTTGYLLLMQHLLITPSGLNFARLWGRCSDWSARDCRSERGRSAGRRRSSCRCFVLTPLAGMEQTAYFGAAHTAGRFAGHVQLDLPFQPVSDDRAADQQQRRRARRFTAAAFRSGSPAGAGSAWRWRLALAAPRLLPLLSVPASIAPRCRSSSWCGPSAHAALGHARWLLVAPEHAGDMLNRRHWAW